MASAARAGRGAIEASRRLLGRGWQGTHGISRVRNASLVGGELLRPRRAVGSGIGTLQRIAGGTSIATTTGNVAEQQVWPMGKAPLSAGTCQRGGGGGGGGGEGEIVGAMEAERCWASGITRRSGSHAVVVGEAAGAIATPVPIARVATGMEPANLIGGGEQRRGFLFPPRTAACPDLDLSSSSSGLVKLSSSAGCRDEETAAPFVARSAGKEGFGGNGWVGGWNVRATRGISSGRRLLYERSLQEPSGHLSAGISIPMGMSTADLESARSVVRTDRDPDFGQQRNQLIRATGCPGAGAGVGGVGGGDGLPVAAPAAGSSPVAAGAASSVAAAVSMPAYVAAELPLDPIVKIFSVSSSPNYFLPWQNKPQRETSGSGFVIKGRRIVTNAHVVADQTFVLVRKHGCSTRFKAEVEAVGHECDLALLRVDNENFWEGMYHLELGEIPNLQEAVAVVGYPQGGDNISVTGGVVSRVEPCQYAHGAAHLMAIQIDAAINPGNSGGPALMEDKVVGVAFQNLLGAENIGYIIPVSIIQHFLEDVEQRGRYMGFCTLGLTCQSMENEQLRQHLNMASGMTGVLVNKIHPLTDVSTKIKKDDVIMAFDGVPISNDGTVPFRRKERISFDYLVSLKKAGESGRLTILREGVQMDLDVIIGPVLLDDVNTGYQHLAELQVKKVNGTAVHNLTHLKWLVEACKEEHLRLDLDDDRVVVLNFAAAKEASRRILQRHRIPTHVSEDLTHADNSRGGAVKDVKDGDGDICSWESVGVANGAGSGGGGGDKEAVAKLRALLAGSRKKRVALDSVGLDRRWTPAGNPDRNCC
ncbi:hypothetical protein CBR_g30063 [Chara braunii]|uniref:Protease Do-like PDZ domain-containing protein n=1 Tax=Chara braunii TaxID=69332 RepID=A0A388LBX2_CHABU|nr:hypothetical protein CBR_g30063 [Chara braunii]|eukprot:GBG79801.1 hypothetical protein CBR_g30063 [Chara braunii]